MNAARMIKVRTQLLAAAVYSAFGVAFAQKEVDGRMPDIREWTSQDGKKLNAAYLGTRGDVIMLKLADGRIAPVALARLTEADREFVVRNRIRSRYQQYEREFANYEMAVAAFLKLPGVTRVGGDKISYPSNLQPPKPPAAPFKDPSEFKTGGLVRLLDGEPANVVGERIEKALTEDLRMMLEFSDNPSTGFR